MTSWSQAPERGAGWLVRLMLFLLRRAGWFATGVVLPGISLWFFLFSPGARAASRAYLGAALGRPPRRRDVLRHVHVFACAILERTILLTRAEETLSVSVEGLAHLECLAAAGRGCILLGAHLGSFAVLRHLAGRCPVPVRMVMHRGNAGAFTRAMEALDPAFARDVIPAGSLDTMLRAHDAVASGAILGMLADRAIPGAQRMAIPFFGRLAPFPTGPFVLAASLGAPVLLFRAVRTGRRRYAIRIEPFADRVVLRRAQRQADLHAVMARYAAWLEESCRAHPYNWFNFFDFWERVADAPTKARPARAAAGHGAVLCPQPKPAA